MKSVKHLDEYENTLEPEKYNFRVHIDNSCFKMISSNLGPMDKYICRLE